MSDTTRLSRFEAARVIAQRDFRAILFSRAFLFFLLGPLFPIIIGVLAGGIGGQVQRDANTRLVAVAMSEADTQALIAARARLAPQIGRALPELAVADAGTAPEVILREPGKNYVAVVGGTLAAPELTAPQPAIDYWSGPVAMLAAEAGTRQVAAYPAVAPRPVATSIAAQRGDRIRTAQAGQLLLFLLMMLLAGMVLSNLVEEKANKVIEVLAAAVPMDAVFLGKLVAMLGVSLVGIAVWAAVGSAIAMLAGNALPQLPAPALGWPLFLALGLVYFAMGICCSVRCSLPSGASRPRCARCRRCRCRSPWRSCWCSSSPHPRSPAPVRRWNCSPLPFRCLRPSRCSPARRNRTRCGRMPSRSAGRRCACFFSSASAHRYSVAAS